jgi:D-arabinose 1-dehydrogenase-like Zn-dependent alcohol dehydrogenase
MRAMQVREPMGAFELVERPLPEPGPSQVGIKVEACGICHSDSFTVEGLFPGITYPRVPGHEIAGHIDAIGPEVTSWRVGQRVGVGWHGGHCGVCANCRRGDFVLCVVGKVPGIAYDGGYADFMIAPIEALAAIPDDLAAVEAAPLFCAGITTYNSLRHSGARPGDLVAVHGLGGLGHLGVQFAVKMGFHTVAIARGADKAKLALELGAHRYIDSTAEDAAKALAALGGAKVILATVTSSKAMSALIDGLGIDGKLLVVGASTEPIEVTPLQLIGNRRSVAGLAVGARGGFGGHHALQRADWRPPDDRDLPAGEGRRRLCADDAR